jgi:hypothetical protein
VIFFGVRRLDGALDHVTNGGGSEPIMGQRPIESGVKPPHSKLLLDLIEGALLRLFVRPPSEKLRAVTEASTGEVIVLDLDD